MTRSLGGRPPVALHGEEGFTLLELLISLTLLAVMVTLTYTVFATAMTSVPRGEEAAERSSRLRMATALLTRQVHSFVDYATETREEQGGGERYTFFRTCPPCEDPDCCAGFPMGFEFITAAPQLGGGEGLAWVAYGTDGEKLVMAERRIFSTSTIAETGREEEEEGEGGTQSAPEAQAVLLSGLKGVRFQYLLLDGAEGEWVDGWDSLEEGGPPGAIRVVLDGLGIGDSYWVEEIPVMPVALALGSFESEVDFDVDEECDLEPPEPDE